MMDAQEFYSNVEYRDDLSFLDLTTKDTNQGPHSYHSYPAKFIPQLAKAMINEFTIPNDYILDSFCGSGTLNVEAFLSNRNSIGTDFNPIAVLISKVKTTPLEPRLFNNFKTELLDDIDTYLTRSQQYYISRGILNGNASVLKKWFPDKSLRELSHILWIIRKKRSGKKYKDLAICAFSSVLKKSSYWLNSSIKSTFDSKKQPDSPFYYFKRQIELMEKTNKDFYNKSKNNKSKTIIFRHNSKHCLANDIPKVDCIITSPPYLVSYDYSDIFKLSTYFLYYQPNYNRFRKEFIGTPLYKSTKKHFNYNAPDQPILNQIDGIEPKRTSTEYYKDMSIYLRNSLDILKEKGHLVMIVGDTRLKGVEIPNAYLITNIATNLGWSLEKVYERKINNKSLPSLRDSKTGKFTNKENENHKEVYKREYILVFQKGR